MRLPLPLALVATLGLSACGAGEEAGSGSTASEPQPEPAALPDVARIVCEPEGARVETSTVKPQADGVHFEIVNDTGLERAISLVGDGGGMGQGAPAGTSTLVADLGPGKLKVACYDPASDAQAGVPLEIVDEDGVYVVAPLECETITSGVLDYIAGAKGEPTPAEAVRGNEGDRILATDELALVGYPESEAKDLAVSRDGTTIAVFRVMSDGQGGWLLESSSFCPPYGER